MRDVKVVEALDPNCTPNGILKHLHKRAVTFPTSVAVSLTSMDTRWSDIHSDARIRTYTLLQQADNTIQSKQRTEQVTEKQEVEQKAAWKYTSYTQ